MSKQDWKQSQYYQEDFLASHSVQLGSEEARKMTVTSGRRCLELYRKSDPVGLLVRMLLESSRWRSTRCYLTWKASATPAKRLLFQLQVSMPRTDDIELQFWATPNTMDALPLRSFEAMKRQATNGGRKNRMRPGNLREQIDPMMCLAYTEARMESNAIFPTPTTGAGMCGGTGNYQQLKVLEATGEITEEERRSMAAGNGGQLNPTWVEWLMGFPIGWTDLDASETP